MSATDCYIFDILYRKCLQNKMIQKKAKHNMDLGLICLIIYVDDKQKDCSIRKKVKKKFGDLFKKAVSEAASSRVRRKLCWRGSG